MKNLMTLLLTLGLATMLTGCVQMKFDTDLKKDGSGTMDMTITMSDVLAEVIAEDAEGSDEIKDLAEMMSLEKKELEKRLKGHDVKIKKFKKGKFNDKEGVNIALEFGNLEALSYAVSQTSNDGGFGLAVFDLGGGKYNLRVHDYGFPVPGEEAGEEESGDVDMEDLDIEDLDMEDLDPEAMQKQMALMGKLMGAMGELEFAYNITVPGNIIESNAMTTEGRTCSWLINASNMMSGNSENEPDITFSAKGLKMKVLQP